MSSSRIVFLAVLALAGPLRAAEGSPDSPRTVEHWSGASWSHGGGATVARLLSRFFDGGAESRQEAVVELADGSRLRLGFEQGDPSPWVMRLTYLDVETGWEAELELNMLLLDEKEERVPTVEEIVAASQAGTMSTKCILTSSDGFRLEIEDPNEEPGVARARLSLDELFEQAIEKQAIEQTPIPESAARGLRTLVALADLDENRATPLETWANSLRLFKAVFASSERDVGLVSAAGELRLRSAMKRTLAELHSTEVGREIRDLELPPSGGS